MRRTSFLVTTLGMILGATLLAPGCGSSKGGDAVPDGAVVTDGASGSDAAAPSDAATLSDTGVLPDAGASSYPSCGTFVACGGSVVGSWNAPGTMECGPSMTTSASCPSYSSSGQFQQSGTLTFSDNGTFSTLVTVTGTQGISYSSSCAGDAGCAQPATSPDSGITVTCGENSPGQCYCNYVANNFTVRSGGPYSTAGNTLTIGDPSLGSADTADYCVQSDTLRMRIIDSSTGEPMTIAYTRK